MHMQVHEQTIICEQCGCQFANQDDLSLHVTKEHAVVIVCDVDQKHRVKELFCCYQCDFDSEDFGDKMHYYNPLRVCYN